MAWVTKHSTETYEPIQQPQYTRSQKAKNWWDYHKWLVLGGAVVVAFLIFVVHSQLAQKQPDYQIGVVAEQELPTDTFEALQEQLAQFGEDLNGDGTVLVQINQYTVQFDTSDEEPNAYSQMAGVTKLGTELLQGQSCYLFLLQHAEAFEENTQALAYLDGSVPAETDHPAVEELCYRWADCPVLAALPLGQYHGYTLMDTQEGESQDVLADYYLARRAYDSETPSEAYAASSALWDKITENAAAIR